MKNTLTILFVLVALNGMSQSSISNISPSTSCPGTNFTMSITGSGTNWVNTSYSYVHVDFPDGIGGVFKFGSPSILSTTSISVPVWVDPWALGKYTTRVIYSDGLGSLDTASLFHGFTVTNFDILAISPDSGYRGDMFPVTITGACTNWVNTSYSYINIDFSSSDVTASNEQIVNTTQATADVDISSMAAYGKLDVYVHYFNGAKAFNDTLKDGFEVLEIVGIDDPWANASKLSVYPNPVNDMAYVAFALDNTSKVTVNVVDQLGRIAYTSSSTMQQGRHLQQLDLTGLSDGIYIVEVNADGSSAARKFIVRR